MQGKSIRKQKCSTRNRKRSKRRAIFCPIHLGYLESRSPKYKVPACQEKDDDAVQIDGAADEAAPFLCEWVESFWCPECQVKSWYHVKESLPRCYEVVLASADLCQQVFNAASSGD